MFGSNYNDTKAMMDDLSNITEMYSQAAPSTDEGIMKAPKSDNIDAGSWWAWLNGLTQQKAQENLKRVQEELGGMDLSGTSPEYQQSMLEGIKQAQAYRDKWGITQSRTGKNTWLVEQGDFVIPEQSEITVEPLDSEPMTSIDQSLMSPAGEPSPDMMSFGDEPITDPLAKAKDSIMRPPEESRSLVDMDPLAKDAVEAKLDTATTTQDVTTGFTSDKELSKGSKNKDYVTALQNTLKASGINLSVDGDFGPGTEAAVKTFQKNNGLEVTGKVDSDTYSKLSQIAKTDDKNPAFYSVSSNDKKVTELGSANWSSPHSTTQNWTLVGGKTVPITGQNKEFKVGNDTINIIDLTSTTGQMDKIKNLPNHTPERIVFHNTAGLYGDKGVVGFMDAQSYPTAQFFIDKKGNIYQLNDPNKEGNHIKGLQTGSVGIEIEGFPDKHPQTTASNAVTKAQDEAAAKLGEYLVNKYPTINSAYSHRELGMDHGKGKTDGWTALKTFRERMGLEGYDMQGKNNTNTFLGKKILGSKYF